MKGASGAYLNPDGARWWDGEGSNGGKTKPKFFYAHSLTDSTITNLYIENTPVQAVSISGCDGLTITDMTINNSAGDTEGGHNTDGFDIGSSTNVVITGANVYNQDDCVAVNSGTEITFSGGVCSGGHGLSIGSVGGRSDNTVDTVTFENCEVKNSVNGKRKAWLNSNEFLFDWSIKVSVSKPPKAILAPLLVSLITKSLFRTSQRMFGLSENLETGT